MTHWPTGQESWPQGAQHPRDVVARLSRRTSLQAGAIGLMGLGMADVAAARTATSELPVTPEKFDAHIRAEVAKFRKLAKDANIKVD